PEAPSEGNEEEQPEPEAPSEGNEEEQPEPEAPSEGNEEEQPEPEAPSEGNEEEGTNDEDTETGNDSMSQFEQEVVDLTNEERTSRGLEPLEAYTDLSDVARVKSEDMRDNNYFSHDSPRYGSPFDMMNEFGIDYRSAGENIAAGQTSPEQVVNGWMNSDGHRANILDPQYTHIGVGHAEGGSYGQYWTQMFMSR
ncbi:CAP domain-containing protein, partial [Geomicrobium sp. JCM 19037]